MALQYALLDVFADAPFQGTQVPVVWLDGADCADDRRTAIAGEFEQTETVFLGGAGDAPASVFNRAGRCGFGAHTILAASYMAFEKGLAEDRGEYSSLVLSEGSRPIESFIDKVGDAPGAIQFSRVLTPTIDRFTPDVTRLAAALGTQARHINYSKYKPRVVSVDRPTLVVPFTRPEHVLAATLDPKGWNELYGEIYTSDLFLFAPGSITGASQFHGRLLNPDLGRGVYPPIGNVLPEFIAYLAEQDDTAPGTHTFSIDRGSPDTRRSLLEVEFDKRPGREVKCRIGGRVIKMGEGALYNA